MITTFYYCCPKKLFKNGPINEITKTVIDFDDYSAFAGTKWISNLTIESHKIVLSWTQPEKMHNWKTEQSSI